MFSFRECSVPGCRTYVSLPYSVCYHHATDEQKRKIEKALEEKLSNDQIIRDVTIIGGAFRDLKVEGKVLKASNFAFSVFMDCTFTETKIINCFFDFCIFIRCSFISSNIRYSVFSGSTIRNCRFNDDVMIHSNFMGIDSIDSSYDQCDLYYSNFSMSKLIRTSFEDSNLKRVNYNACLTKDVSFRYSNPEEAFFSQDQEDVR